MVVFLILGILAILLGPIIGLAYYSNNGNFSGIGFVIAIIGIAFIIIGFFIDNNRIQSENEKTKEKNSNFTPKLLKRVKKFKSDNGFSENEVIEIDDEYFWSNNNYFLSIHNDEFYRDSIEKSSGCYIEELENGTEVNKLDLFERKISMELIEYFQVQGEVIKREKISGGGSSLTGAVVGAVVAGGVGAVVGSRKRIKSTTVTEDNRFILFVYKIGKKLKKEKLDFDLYLEMFENLIPEKEYSYVVSKK